MRTGAVQYSKDHTVCDVGFKTKETVYPSYDLGTLPDETINQIVLRYDSNRTNTLRRQSKTSLS